jgi:hypothetical protein
MEYLRVDPRFDEHPDVEAAGWCAGQLFNFLLRLSARLDLEGVFDVKRADPKWLARRWNLADEELGTGETPADFVARGIRMCLAHGLLEPLEGGGFCIPGWDRFYRPVKTAAERMMEYRERKEGRNAVTPVTDVRNSDATPLHTTPLHTTKKKQEATPAEAAAPPPASKPEELQEVWNRIGDGFLPKWKEMPKARRKAAAARLRERPIEGPEGWREVVSKIAGSPFCRGQNDRGWTADPDWLLKPGTAAKVLEGKYADRQRPRADGLPPQEPSGVECAFPGCGDSAPSKAWGHALCYRHQALLPPECSAGPESVAAWLGEAREVA